MSNYQNTSVQEIRHQLKIAQALAKSHLSFVVVPVKTRAAYDANCMIAIGHLEDIAAIADAEGRS
jgi:hypothetical protein